VIAIGCVGGGGVLDVVRLLTSSPFVGGCFFSCFVTGGGGGGARWLDADWMLLCCRCSYQNTGRRLGGGDGGAGL